MSNVPKLRFKEFSDRVKLTKLNDVVELISGQHLTPEEYQNTENDAPYFTGPSDYTNDLQFVTKWALKKSKVALKDDVLITVKGSGVGELFYLSLNNVVIGRQLMAIRAKEASSKIIYQLLSLRKNTFQALASGNMIPGLSRQDILSQKLNLPSYKEQEKIASFLTTIDIKIEQLTCKEQLLQQYKKGVLQKIFNQEIRFKADDGSEFCDWEEYTLNDFLIPTLREVEKPKENYLAIGVRSHCKGTFQKPDSEPDKIAMDRLYVVKENDLIVNITFAWESAIAIVKKEDEGGLVSHRFPTYTFDEKISNSKYFQYVIIQKRFRIMLDLISPGGAGRNRVMSKKDFLTLKWELPCIEEQNKIANFLSSIDKKIENTKKQLEQTKEFIKALLQQMFV